MEIWRRSPVELPGPRKRSASRNGFSVVLEYDGEGEGPCLVDLSHRSKWDVQSQSLESTKPWGMEVPGKPGRCTIGGGLIIGRQSRKRAAVWHLGAGEPETYQGQVLTDITDGFALLALLGSETFPLMEKVTSLDLCAPGQDPPVWIQGPVLHVPCQVVVLGRDVARAGLLLACPRGYGSSLADALLESGGSCGFRPAGEEAFVRWFESGLRVD